jgi:phosphonate transport system substrate-binding protein
MVQNNKMPKSAIPSLSHGHVQTIPVAVSQNASGVANVPVSEKNAKISPRLKNIASLLLLCLVLISGCSKERGKSSKPEEHLQPFIIGVVPEQDIFKQAERYQPLADYLTHKLGVIVKIEVMPSYGNALRSFEDKRMDAAFFGSMTYVLAHARLGVEVLARPVALDGNSTYRGMMFVRKDSNIQSIREMKGKRFVFVDMNTTAGYLLPLAYFKKRGVDYKTYLKEFYFSGTHEDAIYDVLERKADIGVAKSTILKEVGMKDPGIANKLTILARTPPVPENSIAVRRNLNGPLKDKLKATLLAMHEDPEGVRVLKEFKALKFIETTDSDFKSVYSFARDLGIEVYLGYDEQSP